MTREPSYPALAMWQLDPLRSHLNTRQTGNSNGFQKLERAQASEICYNTPN